jgi:ADP-heptose:LPS heptosyltransferase
MQYPDFNITSDKYFSAALPQNFIVVAPNAGWPQREWPSDKWVEFAKLVAAGIHMPIVQVGGPDDKPIAGCIDYRGISFNQLGLLMTRASAFVGCDSFPMHMAHALLPQKSNMIIITCATSAENFPIGRATEIREESCLACRKYFGEGTEVLKCKDPHIKMVQAERVYNELNRLLR